MPCYIERVGKRKALILLVILVSVAALSMLLLHSQDTVPTPIPTPAASVFTQMEQDENNEVSFTATFEISTLGTIRDFSSPRYHNLSEDVFIEAGNPRTVQVRKVGITWGDFFETLPMELTNECLVTGTKQKFCSNQDQQLQFFINGSVEPDALEKEIQSGNHLLVRYR